MKLVSFTRDMAPFVKGESRAVPDDVATRLIAEGAAEARPSVFDAVASHSPTPAQPRQGHRSRKGL